MKWSQRFQWLRSETPEQQKAIVRTVRSPGDVLLDELARNGEATKLSLSRSAKRMAAESETAKLDQAPLVHKAAQVAALVHGWNDQASGPSFSLNVLNVQSFGVEIGDKSA